MKTRLHTTRDAAGYQMYNNGAATGKANANNLPSFSSKNGRPTAANITPSSPKNSVEAQRRPSCTREQITPQVSPNTATKLLQCAASAPPQILSHHLLISQFCSRHHLLHLLMRLMHIQPLCQTFQLHSA